MTTSESSAQALNPRGTSKGCILVVDDNVKILKFIRLSLTLAGYVVITSTGGYEALRLLESEKPNVMVLSILTPVVDGLEVLRRARAVSEAPVIAVSIYSSAAQEALRLGANDLLIKPFRPDELVEKIKALVNH